MLVANSKIPLYSFYMRWFFKGILFILVLYVLLVLFAPSVKAAVCGSCTAGNCCGFNCFYEYYPDNASCSGSPQYGCDCVCQPRPPTNTPKPTDTPAPTRAGGGSPTDTPKPKYTPHPSLLPTTAIPSPYWERCGSGWCGNGYYCCQNLDGSKACCPVGTPPPGGGVGGPTATSYLRVRLFNPQMTPVVIQGVNLCKANCTNKPCYDLYCKSNLNFYDFPRAGAHQGGALQYDSRYLKVLGITPYQNGNLSSVKSYPDCRGANDIKDCATWREGISTGGRVLGYIVVTPTPFLRVELFNPQLTPFSIPRICVTLTPTPTFLFTPTPTPCGGKGGLIGDCPIISTTSKPTEPWPWGNLYCDAAFYLYKVNCATAPCSNVERCNVLGGGIDHCDFPGADANQGGAMVSSQYKKDYLTDYLIVLGITPYQDDNLSSVKSYPGCRGDSNFKNCAAWSTGISTGSRVLRYIVVTNTPTPIPNPNWAKLKNTSFYTNKDLNNPLPATVAAYDADDDGTRHFLIASPASDPGLVAAASIYLNSAPAP
ncbi:MAG: hypothetical protein ACP5QU_02585 [Anaerolineae bacterium]